MSEAGDGAVARVAVNPPAVAEMPSKKRRWAVPGFELLEARRLSLLIYLRMNRCEPPPASGASNEGTHWTWVEAEFQNPLETMLAKKNVDAWLFACTSLILVAGGFATSGIAAAGNAHGWEVFAIGLLVAFVGGMSQLFRFGVRADRRRAIAMGLREEGWRFVFGDGEYTDERPDVSMTFRRRVAEVNQQMAEAGTLEADAGRKAASAERLAHGDEKEAGGATGGEERPPDA